jgi:hypothetical protein
MLQAGRQTSVCNVLKDGFEVYIEGGHCLDSPRVIKNNVFKALHGQSK